MPDGTSDLPSSGLFPHAGEVDLEALKALLAAATPLPWNGMPIVLTKADRDLFLAAVNALPALLALVEQLTAERDASDAEGDRRADAIRAAAIAGFGEVRGALLAALGIDDDHRTQLVAYVAHLAGERDALRAQVEALTAERDRAREAVSKVEHLNQPMLTRLRKCAADTSPNWDGAVTLYPPETRGLVALIDAALAVPAAAAVVQPAGEAATS